MRDTIWVFVALALMAPRQAEGQSDERLGKILEDVRSAYNSKQRPMVVFDLEGTLFDTRYRTLKILQEFADAELASTRPDAAATIHSLKKEQIGYKLTDTLTNAEITESAVLNNAVAFWTDRYFEDEYLRYDHPRPGVVEYIRTLYSSGARIVYLCARDVPRQLMGTVRALRKHGFPIGIQGTELIMKPTTKTQDAIFKRQAVNYLRHYGTVIATFDNEPANANTFRRAFPKATVVAVEAQHSPNPPVLLPNVAKVMSFE